MFGTYLLTWLNICREFVKKILQYVNNFFLKFQIYSVYFAQRILYLQ